jgi:DNA polymerase III epsilon subunit family exonuclease
MHPYPNLISNSILINATIEFLRSIGGRASAVTIVVCIMNIRCPDPGLARLLVADLVNRDPRLSLRDDIVEFVAENHSAVSLADVDFIVLDFETTGAKTPPCRVTEIGAYRVRGREIVAEFHTLINPEMPIPFFITMLTGISDEMVRHAPKFGDVAGEFLTFIGNSVLVAHNAGFDVRFLNHEVGRVYEDYSVGNPSLCTVQLSRRLLPDIDNHKLKTVANYYSVELINHHRANADAYATAKIFVNLLEGLETHGVVDLASAQAFGSKKHYVRRGKTGAGKPSESEYHADAA